MKNLLQLFNHQHLQAAAVKLNKVPWLAYLRTESELRIESFSNWEWKKSFKCNQIMENAVKVKEWKSDENDGIEVLFREIWDFLKKI